MAWGERKVTDDDVIRVLRAHGLPTDTRAVQVARDAVESEVERVDDAVYSYAYEGDPAAVTTAVLYEIETLLQDYEIIPENAPPKFGIAFKEPSSAPDASGP